jgi:hypothetical protein
MFNYVAIKHKQMSFVSNGGKFKLYTVPNGLHFSTPANSAQVFIWTHDRTRWDKQYTFVIKPITAYEFKFIEKLFCRLTIAHRWRFFNISAKNLLTSGVAFGNKVGKLSILTNVKGCSCLFYKFTTLSDDIIIEYTIVIPLSKLMRYDLL